ncbi:tetratricopeptide repeat protein [Frankia sp. QA3]|uniref:tetratricopeptide repeat protein n=1 Tax=Frankia sp. QA3 TaxID=710111 RepID=UPI000269BC04|nr:tetratricopeptide repeat protein [Frankia sp. QA3]EIV92659.1 TPR repeat-containing protein [Frankia sp. QA3]
MLLFCGGYGCPRSISISVIPGGNPTALENPDEFSIVYSVCMDCRAHFCDRCAPAARDRPRGTVRCRRCTGELVDGQGWERQGKSRHPEAVLRYNEAAKHREDGANELVVAVLDKAIALRPKFAAAHTLKGRALRDLGRNPDAVAAFDMAILIDPLNIEAMLEKGWTLGHQQPGPALAAYEMAVAVEPRFLLAQLERASILNTLGRYEEALRVVDQAIAIEQGKLYVGQVGYARSRAFGTKAMILVNFGRDQECLAAVDIAIDSGPDFPLNYKVKALALERLGRVEEARLARRIEEEILRRSGA